MPSENSNQSWIFAWHKNQYFHGWFSWIEWLGLTAALIASSMKMQGSLLQVPISILALVSTIFVYFSGLAGIISLIEPTLLKIGLPQYLKWPAAVILSIVITGTVLLSLVSVIMALLAV